MKNCLNRPKWLFAAVLCLLLCLMCAWAAAETEGDFVYSITDNKATLTGYTGSETTVTVPATLGGCTVDGIGALAFDGLVVERIDLPGTITVIDENAFGGCGAELYVSVQTKTSFALAEAGLFHHDETLPDYVVNTPKYGNYSSDTVVQARYVGDRNAVSIVVPSTIKRLAPEAFAGMTSLTSVTLGNNYSSSYVEIGQRAFAGCTALRTVTGYSRNALGTIDDGAFDGCTALVTVDTRATSIGAGAFNGCTSLKSIFLADNLTTIGEGAFEGCPAALYCTDGSVTAQTLAAIGKTGAPISAPGLTFTKYSNLGWTVTAFDGSVTDVVIPEGVECINSSIFRDSAITSVSLPSSLKTINSSAFYNCIGLTEVTLPEGLETISSSAFSYCTNLKQIEIPASVKTLGSNAFYRCLSLESVTLNEGLDRLEYNVFSYAPIDAVELPDTLTYLDCSAFSNTNVTSLQLPENLTYYSAASGIRSWVSRDSVTAHAMATRPNYSAKPFADPEMPDFDLYYLINEYTGEHNLALYKYHGRDDVSVTVPDGIVAVYRQAFYQYDYNAGISGNDVLEEIILPDSVTSIDTNAFYELPNLKALYLPDNIATFGSSILSSSYGTQIFCSKDSVTAQNLTTSIYSKGFVDPAEPDFGLCYTSDKTGLILSAYYGTAAKVTVPEGIVAIGSKAFYENAALEEIVLPEGLTEIQNHAFYRCSALSRINFPSTLLSIGSTAFNSCNNLKSVTLPDSLTTLGSNCFLCSLDEIYLPDNITTVDTYPFYDSCRIYCKKGSVTAYNVSAENTGYRLCDPADPEWRWRYDENGGLLFGGYLGTETEITLSDEYVGIAAYAFSSASTTLKKVIFPETITSLGYHSLDSSIETHLPDNITTAHAEAMAWDDWYSSGVFYVSKDSVTFDTLLSLGKAFVFCDPADPDWIVKQEKDGSLTLQGYTGSDTHLVIPDGIQRIGRMMSEWTPGYRSIVRVDVPESVTRIGDNAFLWPALEEVHLPDHVNFDTYPFEAQAATTVFCTKGSETAYNLIACYERYSFCDPADPDWRYAYDENGDLLVAGYRGEDTVITLPQGAVGIADEAWWTYGHYYQGESRITSITIPEGYTAIGDEAFFHGGNQLSHVSLPSTLRSIGSEAFWACNIAMLQLPEGLETIGENAFRHCHNLTSLTIPSTVTSIPHVIVDGEFLTTVVLPEQLTEIADGAFGSELSSVYCYRNSYAAQWAKEQGVAVRYISDGTLENQVKITYWGMNEEVRKEFDAGVSYDWMDGIAVSVLPPNTTYTFQCTSSNPSVVTISGAAAQMRAVGTATLTISIAERPDVTPVRLQVGVYPPLESFRLPRVLLVKYESKDWNVPILEMQPQNGNPNFVVNGGMYYRAENGYIEYLASPFELGARRYLVETWNHGFSQEILLITYEEINSISAEAPSRALAVGDIYEPTVILTIDWAEWDNLADTYDLTSSNTAVAVPQGDGRILAAGPGTATITVTERYTGKKASFNVAVEERIALKLPYGLMDIQAEAFAGTAAREVVIRDGCRQIGPLAFAGSPNLIRIDIPASVTNIADDAFEGCPSGLVIAAPSGSAAHQYALDHGIDWVGLDP